MHEKEYLIRRRYYRRTIDCLENTIDVPDDLCFVLVQHAFLPSIDYYSAIENRVAAIILKGSSATQNPTVVAKLKELFGSRVHQNIRRSDLKDHRIALELLKKSTAGRPFVVLEYGAYFAPVIPAIVNDPQLGRNLLGVVEGTENGVKGSSDGNTPGYSAVAERALCPIISKSRSNIKHIMDIEIGPAIVYSSDNILYRVMGHRLKHWRSTIGVVGLGSIGRGILSTLKRQNHHPLIYDSDVAVMAELAHRQNSVVNQQTVLENSDILFLNTGDCFLSHQPDLLRILKNNALLILCTSGDVEAGIPQLIAAGHLKLVKSQSCSDIAVYTTRFGKCVRLMLGTDGVGQAPNMSVEDGSASPANVMSDMEFYALGCYLGTSHSLSAGKIHQSPKFLQNLILKEWLAEYYPSSTDALISRDPLTGSIKDIGPAYQHRIAVY